jgi:uncharacterized membrane protein YjgN (DUF898 family)
MTTLDFDTLQQRWQTQDAKLDQVLSLNRRMLGAMERDKTRGALDGVFKLLWWQFAIDGLAVFLLGYFVGNRLLADGQMTAAAWDAQFRYLLPAAVLAVGAIAVLASVIKQLAMLYAIDPSKPVSEVQQTIEQLHAHRVWVAKAVILVAPVLWVPIMIVGLQGLLGFDVYALVPKSFIWINLVVCGLFVPVVYGLARVYGERAMKYPWVRRLHDELAGRAMVEARERLAELEAFRRGD